MSMESCRNPLNPNCKNTDIAVYIMVGDERLPICSKCWRAIADEDYEWGEDGFKLHGEEIRKRGVKRKAKRGKTKKRKVKKGRTKKASKL